MSELDVTANWDTSCRRLLDSRRSLIVKHAAPDGTECGGRPHSYTWNLDIVVLLSDAVAVSTLCQIADRPRGTTHLPSDVGIGNIVAQIDGATGAPATVYEFPLNGEPLQARTIDPTIADKAFRRSTGGTDDETWLVYYGRRYCISGPA